MRIAIASPEMVPYVKVGGLADVTGALSKELARMGHEVRAFLPRPPGLTPERYPGHSIREAGNVPVKLFGGSETARIEIVSTEEPNLELVLIRHDPFFERPNPYVDPKTGQDWPDNARRFVFYSKAILESMRLLGWVPDALHLNDYPTGLVPVLLREGMPRGDVLQSMGILFAIHNMGYQGIYPPAVLPEIGAGIDRLFYPGGPMEYWGKVNFMKVAILYADRITTVSERYAIEIQQDSEHGCGLEGVLRTRSADIKGILNGIDCEVWDPATDPLIPANYSASDLGPKRENKARLLSAMELPEDLETPVIGIISRLVDQKGFDLIEKAAENLMAMDMRLVVLGSGLPKYETLMQRLRERFPAKVSVALTFSEPLAHLIEAGSDFFLMPSRYEPCGLNQMYSLRYGTIPIVRATGGLADTITEFDPESSRGNGFLFDKYDADAMVEAVRRGLAAYARKRVWKRLVSTVMRSDHSWTRAAAKYVETYQKIAALRR